MAAWGWHFEWLYSTKMLVTVGVLTAWWGVSLFLGSRIGRFIGDRQQLETPKSAPSALGWSAPDRAAERQATSRS